jgi:hypothetical protein
MSDEVKIVGALTFAVIVGTAIAWIVASQYHDKGRK